MPVYQSNKVSKATKHLVKGSQDIINQAQKTGELQRGLFQPYADFSREGLNALRDFESQLAMGDYSQIENDPYYQYRRTQAINAKDRTAGARGGLYGGAHLKDIMTLSDQMASQEAENKRNRLLGNIQLGYPAVGAQASAYGNELEHTANALKMMAEARANKQKAKGSIWGKFFEDVAKGFGKGTG